MDVNSAGEVIRRRMAVTVIRSCRRFTYEEVQTLLDGQSVRSVTAPVAEAVLRMELWRKYSTGTALAAVRLISIYPNIKLKQTLTENRCG